MPLTFTPRTRTAEDKIVYFTSPVNLPTLNLGDFTVQTNNTGALTVQPKDQVLVQPAFIAKPVSISSDISGIFLLDSAETGGRVLLVDLLNKLIDIPISIGNIEMPIRSLFGSLFARVAAEEAATIDISNNRIPAVLNEVVNNASLDAAREAAQALKDAAQDATAAQAALEAATATSDIAAIAGRVTALESAPGFDSTALEARVTAAEGQITTIIDAKLDVSTYTAEKATFAAAADLTALDNRVIVTETYGGRIDAVEAAVVLKVADTDYQVFVAATNAALDGKAAVADLAAKADASALALKEDIGRMHKVDMVLTDVSGVNAAYWSGSLDATIGAIVSAGKVAEFINSDVTSHFLSAADAAEAGTAYRFKNSGAYNWVVVLGSQGGTSIEVIPGETMTVIKQAGGEWKIL